MSFEIPLISFIHQAFISSGSIKKKKKTPTNYVTYKLRLLIYNLIKYGRKIKQSFVPHILTFYIERAYANDFIVTNKTFL